MGRFIVKFVAWIFLGSLLASILLSSMASSVPVTEQENWLNLYMPWIMIGSLLLSAILLDIGGIRSFRTASKQEAKEDGHIYYKQGLSLMNKGLFKDAEVEFMKVIQNSSPESRWYSSAQTRLLEINIHGE
jgi:hypothetical protein